MRIEANKAAVIDESFILRVMFFCINIRKVGNLLKGEKADANGKNNILQRDAGMEQGVQIGNNKVGIFVPAESK